jgi:hypothetical protein
MKDDIFQKKSRFYYEEFLCYNKIKPDGDKNIFYFSQNKPPF